jgi:hypothetical protein
MAKQDFLNGGFIGKVGQVVGEHWHNIRYIRAYAVPKNPKTDKQMAVRGVFGTAIDCAKIAYASNGHDGNWESDTLPEFQLRTSQALKALHNGASPEDAIPWYPPGKTPTESHIISTVEPNQPKSLTIKLADLPLTRPYQYTIAIEATDPLAEAIKVVSFNGAGTSSTAEFRWSYAQLAVDPYSMLKIGGNIVYTDVGAIKTASIGDWVGSPAFAGTTAVYSTETSASYDNITRNVQIGLRRATQFSGQGNNVMVAQWWRYPNGQIYRRTDEKTIVVSLGGFTLTPPSPYTRNIVLYVCYCQTSVIAGVPYTEVARLTKFII